MAAPAHRGAAIVGGQQVLALEEGIDSVADGQIGLVHQRLAGPQLQLHPLPGAPVDVESQRLGGRRAAPIGDGDPNVKFGGSGFDVEVHDGSVGSGRPDLLIGHARREQSLFLLAQTTVGEQDEPDGRVGRLEPFRERERRREVGTARCGPGRRDGLVEGIGIGARREQHSRLRADLDDAGGASAGQFAADFAGPGSGIGDPVGLAVEREHRSGAVDEEHGVRRKPRLFDLHGVGDGDGEQTDAEQLEQQQPRGSDHSERRGRRDGTLDGPPQECGAHHLAGPPRLEHVQEHDRHDQ